MTRAVTSSGRRSAPTSGEGRGIAVECLGGLHRRLKDAVGPISYADLADRTGYNRETVRRFMRGGTPSVGFVVAVSVEFDCSLNWLLLGYPPRAAGDTARAHLHGKAE